MMYEFGLNTRVRELLFALARLKVAALQVLIS